eukprot:10160031-Ditylum_brightwellii.AAC.1
MPTLHVSCEPKADAQRGTISKKCVGLERRLSSRALQLSSSSWTAGVRRMRPEVRERRSWSRQKSPIPPGIAGTTLRKVLRSFCHRDEE